MIETLKKFSKPLIILVAISLVVGGLGGVLGALPIISSSINGPGYLVNTNRNSETNLAAIENAARSRVLFFADENFNLQNSTSVVGDLRSIPYFNYGGLGRGVVLTSDGWLLTTASVAGASKKLGGAMVAVIGGRIYKVDQKILDPYSGVALVHVNATNLAVIDIDETIPTVDEAVYVLGASAGINKYLGGGFDVVPETTPADFNKSSEKIHNVIRLNGLVGVMNGEAVLNNQGKLIGLTRTIFNNSFVIPSLAMDRVLSGAIKTKKFPRPVLGINYFDGSRMPATLKGFTRGAVVSNVSKMSKAAPQNNNLLKIGDLILSINDEDVSPKRGLSDILVEYAPGTTVTLTVNRAGDEIKIPVKLQ